MTRGAAGAANDGGSRGSLVSLARRGSGDGEGFSRNAMTGDDGVEEVSSAVMTGMLAPLVSVLSPRCNAGASSTCVGAPWSVDLARGAPS